MQHKQAGCNNELAARGCAIQHRRQKLGRLCGAPLNVENLDAILSYYYDIRVMLLFIKQDLLIGDESINRLSHLPMMQASTTFVLIAFEII